MNIKIVDNQKMLSQALKVREIVFINEQKVPLSEEIDQYENEATHFLVYNKKNQPVATCRTRVYSEDTIKIERVCVLKNYRGLKIGEEMMIFAENEAKKQGFKKAILGAQTQALDFYKKLGYQVCSEPFMDSNIEHYLMDKSL